MGRREDRSRGAHLEVAKGAPATSRQLAKGKKPDDRLFGEVNRHWVLRSVKRCCAAAGVPIVTPHGLRGTHAKVAREAGVSGVLLAAMGHESETTTTEHYAGPDAVQQGAIERVSAALS